MNHKWGAHNKQFNIFYYRSKAIINFILDYKWRHYGWALPSRNKNDKVLPQGLHIGNIKLPLWTILQWLSEQMRQKDKVVPNMAFCFSGTFFLDKRDICFRIALAVT